MAARILVVDDEPQVRATVREALAYEGYDVIEAADGAQALDVIPRTSPDVVVLDLWMPVMDGWTLRKRLQERYPEIPVIVLSAMEMKDADLIALDAFVLEKPFELDELYAAIRSALERG